MFHIDQLATGQLIGTRSDKGKTINAYSSGIVNQTFGTAFISNYTYAHQSGKWGGSCVLIKQPLVDATPYRVKIYVYCSTEDTERYLIVGTAPAAPTGNDDLIENVYPIPFKSDSLDEVILIPSPPVGFEDRALAIGLGLGAAGSGNALVEAAMSVQNLSMPAPQFSASMS